MGPKEGTSHFHREEEKNQVLCHMWTITQADEVESVEYLAERTLFWGGMLSTAKAGEGGKSL